MIRLKERTTKRQPFATVSISNKRLDKLKLISCHYLERQTGLRQALSWQVSPKEVAMCECCSQAKEVKIIVTPVSKKDEAADKPSTSDEPQAR